MLSAHREENVSSESNFRRLFDVIKEIEKKYDFPIIVSTHPRTRKLIEERNPEYGTRVNFVKPLGFSDYNKLQVEAKTVLSDSGTITEESSIMNFRALNI